MECIYQGNNDCMILNSNDCNNCKFRQSNQQSQDNKTKSLKRLSSLSPMKQSYIADKYYRGRMPWATNSLGSNDPNDKIKTS